MCLLECLDKYKSNFWSKQKICVRELLNNLLASPYLEEEGIKKKIHVSSSIVLTKPNIVPLTDCMDQTCSILEIN